MEATAILVAILAAIFVAIILLLMPILLEERWRAAQEKARARRIADARMNARLLRFNI